MPKRVVPTFRSAVKKAVPAGVVRQAWFQRRDADGRSADLQVGCQQGDTFMAVDVGSKAPDFTLVNQDREPVTLSQELGKRSVVLAFFPGAFSGTCTKEFCNFRDTMSNFTTMNAKVLGISTDTFFALKAWDEQQKLGFPLLSDYNKEVINKYGVVNPDMIGLKNIAKRAVFVIDKGGIVRYREVLDDARNEPDYAKLNEALGTLGN
jgi:glutaredoxin-dependent peroxiredoxin